ATATPPAPAAAPSSPRALGAVLDIGCGNARFACFLHEAGFAFGYTGVDANASLLEAAQRQLPEASAATARLIRHDFLAGEVPGAGLPEGPFELVVLMGVLHHVPGADWRLALLRSAASRLAPGGRLALATWQFAGDPREERKRVAFETAGSVLGRSIEAADLEPGDALLRFGSDPTTPPRYCHAVAGAEFESWPRALGLELVADFRADGARDESNRYALLRRP
ncbi:MAG: class I SAM-dependent methyltransferase, partial [Thermoleophilia bacterium]|nr:class I SAM-dependent methyltransferase [Thermoleophilia bacterium]